MAYSTGGSEYGYVFKGFNYSVREGIGYVDILDCRNGKRVSISYNCYPSMKSAIEDGCYRLYCEREGEKREAEEIRNKMLESMMYMSNGSTYTEPSWYESKVLQMDADGSPRFVDVKKYYAEPDETPFIQPIAQKIYCECPPQSDAFIKQKMNYYKRLIPKKYEKCLKDYKGSEPCCIAKKLSFYKACL